MKKLKKIVLDINFNICVSSMRKYFIHILRETILMAKNVTWNKYYRDLCLWVCYLKCLKTYLHVKQSLLLAAVLACAARCIEMISHIIAVFRQFVTLRELVLLPSVSEIMVFLTSAELMNKFYVHTFSPTTWYLSNNTILLCSKACWKCFSSDSTY